MKTYSTGLIAAVTLVVVGTCSAQAAHKDVKHCANDYKQYCHQ